VNNLTPERNFPDITDEKKIDEPPELIGKLEKIVFVGI
jgi:hypothetical protein